MSQKQNKIPDVSEMAHMVGKLFGDVKNSISEIITEYKTKRTDTDSNKPVKKKAESKTEKDSHKPDNKD